MNVRTVAIAALTASVALAAACGSKGSSAPDDATLAGDWQYVDGPFLGAAAGLPATTFMSLDRSGTVTIDFRSPEGTVGCASAIFAVSNGGLVSFDVPASSGGELGGPTIHYFRWSREGSRLFLVDENGALTTFEHVDAIPEAAGCGVATLPSSSTIVLDAAHSPGDRTIMSSDGTFLWWRLANYSSTLVSLDPVTKSTGESVTFAAPSQFLYPKAVQGTSFWMSCFCGADQELDRFDRAGTMVDAVDTSAAPIDHSVGVDGVVFDGTDLWIAGANRDVPGFALLQIDASNEPDVLLSSHPIDVSPEGAAFLGPRFLVVSNFFVSPSILEIDPQTGAAIHTWTLPADRRYGSLAVAGGRVWVLSQRPSAGETVTEIDEVVGL